MNPLCCEPWIVLSAVIGAVLGFLFGLFTGCVISEEKK